MSKIRTKENGSTNDDWATPDWLLDEIRKEFGEFFDPCPLNSKFDWLDINTKWGKSNFINPPYDRINKPKFIKRAYEEWKKGATCVLLIPSATWTKQFHELILPNAEIRFIKWRIAFEWYNTEWKYTTKWKGKHDSMLVIFK